VASVGPMGCTLRYVPGKIATSSRIRTYALQI